MNANNNGKQQEKTDELELGWTKSRVLHTALVAEKITKASSEYMLFNNPDVPTEIDAEANLKRVGYLPFGSKLVTQDVSAVFGLLLRSLDPEEPRAKTDFARTFFGLLATKLEAMTLHFGTNHGRKIRDKIPSSLLAMQKKNFREDSNDDVSLDEADVDWLLADMGLNPEENAEAKTLLSGDVAFHRTVTCNMHNWAGGSGRIFVSFALVHFYLKKVTVKTLLSRTRVDDEYLARFLTEAKEGDAPRVVWFPPSFPLPREPVETLDKMREYRLKRAERRPVFPPPPFADTASKRETETRLDNYEGGILPNKKPRL